MRLPRNIFHLLIMLEAAVLVVVIIFGAVHVRKDVVQTKRSASEAEAEKKADKADREKFVTKQEDTGGESEASAFSEEVQAKLAVMTLEEKVAQMFIITPEALTHSDAVEVAGESTQAAISIYPVGGLVYSAVNLKNRDQTRDMLAGVQEFGMERIGLPMFLAIQELGGIENSPVAVANGYELQRSPLEIGAEGDAAQAAQTADAVAGYLAEEGFNLNLMPVAETAEEGSQEARYYGSDAQSVSMMAAEAVNATRVRGIRTAVGTFPGRRTAESVGESWDTWKDQDGLAFRACIDTGAECIILSNVTCEGLTGNPDVLCSLSESAVSYLRNDMGYTGIIMTDSLSDEAVTGRYSSGDAAVEAVKSGVDMLYCPASFEEAYQAVIDAVNSSAIPMETIDRAAGYILTQKLAMAGGV